MQTMPFAAAADEAASLPWSVQRLVNFFPVPQEAPGKKTNVALYGTPGLTLFSTLSSANPVRGMKVYGDYLWAARADAISRVASDGTATTLTGTFAGGGIAIFTPTRTQLLVSDTATGRSYSIDTTALSITELADTDFPGAASAAFLDGYVIVHEPNSDRFWWSDPDDLTTWSALDFATAEADPYGLVRVFVHRRQLLLFGGRTMEVWYNNGTSPFARYGGPDGVIEIGCAAKHSVTGLDGDVFFLADDRTVRRLQGSTPVRVSTHSIEHLLSEFETVSDCEAFGHVWKGHPMLVMTFPSADRTLVYDTTTDRWHERRSGTGDTGRWLARGYEFFGGKHIVGDYSIGRLYELDDDAYTENGATFVAEAVTPHWHGNRERVRLGLLEIEFEAGSHLASGQGSDPQAMLSNSDDGGRTWSSERWRAMGKAGQYSRRARWAREGSFYSRSYRVRISDPVKRTILGAYANVS